ncbi:aldose epimerase family protein [Breoghania sp.]|uniref:aldose epimerase family protein n=1 Tax=Breoghania sp. TaxID=2065378 RepID=UPI002AAAD114|nr:aldose epimerase family protein [Breoghania sp.]
MDRDIFGVLPDGREVERIRLTAGKLEASVLTWGATVQDLRLAGRPMVIGADHLDAYLGDLLYAGAIVGRFANRIAGARFNLDNTTFHTDPNFRARHTLHGGHGGTGEQLWRLDRATTDQVRLSLCLPDGHMGFPGELTVAATYSVEPPATLRIRIEARTTRATPCSFAHHGYFTLDGSGDIKRHRLTVAADHYLPVDQDLIPTGQIASVEGTAFDFRKPREIGSFGYDHNFCLNDSDGTLRDVALLESPESGISLAVSTTEPGLQIYDGGHLEGARAYAGTPLKACPGLAMETQAWPDSPNQHQFPPCILRPGAVYRTETSYRF